MIPKKIYQTHKDYNLSSNLKSLIHNMVSLNPEFEYTFMDNDECFKFIEENFDKDFFEMYKNLPLDIMRADVWRVAVIYVNGGIYCDTDVLFYKPISPLIENEDLVVFTESGGGVSNFFFASKPKHPSLKSILDLMVKNQNMIRDTNSDWLVQNFGMDLLHKVMVQTENKKQLTYEESREWVNHMCYGSWRNDERDYKNESNTTKQLTFFTTFHQSGYDLYGKTWIESFIKNVTTKSNNINAIIYSDNIPNLEINHPQIKVIDFHKMIPEHKLWKKEFLDKSTYSPYINNMTIRFSHKGFVIQHALSTVKEGYLIWLDGDGVFNDNNYKDFPSMFFTDNEVIACQIEDGNHVESGILIFDVENEDLVKFTEKYKKNYNIEEILYNYGEPYDGHVTRRSLDHSGVKYYDLNKNFGRGGIQSDPNETFLHPEISSRFSHNIGITGKRNYDTWDDVKEKDNIFSVLEQGGFKPLTKEQLRIKKLRNKRKI
jgi:mannosyltransferase OCH1-like enzyme